MIFRLRQSAIATFLVFLVGACTSLAQGNGDSQPIFASDRGSFQTFSSEGDLWKKFSPTTHVYIDGPDVAKASKLSSLNAWLTSQPHPWYVMLMNHLDGDQFVQQIRSHKLSPAFHKITREGIPDGNLILIARLSTWKPNDPHYAINVYTGDWLEHHGLGASSARFYNSVLPTMKVKSNAEGPISGAKAGIKAFNSLLSTTGIGNGPALPQGNLETVEDQTTNPYIPWIAVLIVALVIAAAFAAAKHAQKWTRGNNSSTDGSPGFWGDWGGGGDGGGSGDGGGGFDGGGSFGGGHS